MTFPTLFMGIGNIIGMPLALAIGRRPVFLLSSAVLVISCILCATQKSYEWHLAARMVLGLAAGQSEALCPLMVQETFYLHERGKYQMIFTAAGNILTTAFTIVTSYIAKGIGARGWYGLGSGLAGAIMIVSIFFLPETKYDRPLSAYQGQAGQVSTFATSEGEERPGAIYATARLSTLDTVELDFVNYKPRTLASDMRLFVNKPDWEEGLRTVRRMCVVMFFPDILWAFVSPRDSFHSTVSVILTQTCSSSTVLRSASMLRSVPHMAILSALHHIVGHKRTSRSPWPARSWCPSSPCQCWAGAPTGSSSDLPDVTAVSINRNIVWCRLCSL